MTVFVDQLTEQITIKITENNTRKHKKCNRKKEQSFYIKEPQLESDV